MGRDGDTHAGADLGSYLLDLHELETRSIRFLETARRSAGAPALAAVFGAHLEETLEQRRRVAERLAERGDERPERAADSGLGVGDLDLDGFLAAPPDTASKLAAFAIDFEQLEIEGYGLLAQAAAWAGDEETFALAVRAQREERTAAAAIAGALDAALATLDATKLAPAP